MATGRQHCYAAQTAMQQGMEGPSQMVALGWCSEVVGTQLAGPCGTGALCSTHLPANPAQRAPRGPSAGRGWRLVETVFAGCFFKVLPLPLHIPA